LPKRFEIPEHHFTLQIIDLRMQDHSHAVARAMLSDGERQHSEPSS